MSGRLSEGPAANDEAAFRLNVRQAVNLWRERLAVGGAPPRAGGWIGGGGARAPPGGGGAPRGGGGGGGGATPPELRKVAESRGWWALAQHLGNVETLSRTAPP